MLSIQERLALQTESIQGAAWQWASMLRVATPGTVVSFDAVKQTCVVQPNIQELILMPPPVTSQNPNPGTSQNIPTAVTIKPIQDVPIIMMRVPGWSITFPIVPGTECLLIFADSCIDGWWQNSGVQAPFDRRRHDLSDAFALFGPWSQPHKLVNYSTTSVQLRSDDQSVMIDLAVGEINVDAPIININGPAGTTIEVNSTGVIVSAGAASIDVSIDGSVTITGPSGIVLAGPTSFGGGTSPPPNPQTGFFYFDTTLGYPLFYNGTAWVNASGGGTS